MVTDEGTGRFVGDRQWHFCQLKWYPQNLAKNSLVIFLKFFKFFFKLSDGHYKYADTHAYARIKLDNNKILIINGFGNNNNNNFYNN